MSTTISYSRCGLNVKSRWRCICLSYSTKRKTMKKKITFDPAWVILLLVIGTIVTLNFMDEEHLRNVIAGSVLAGCFLLFATSIVVRSFGNRFVKEQL